MVGGLLVRAGAGVVNAKPDESYYPVVALTIASSCGRRCIYARKKKRKPQKYETRHQIIKPKKKEKKDWKDTERKLSWEEYYGYPVYIDFQGVLSAQNR